METRSRLRPRKESSTEKLVPAKRGRPVTAGRGRGRKRVKAHREPAAQDEIEVDNGGSPQAHFSPHKLAYSRRGARRADHGDAAEVSSLMSVSQVQEGHDSEHDVSSPIRPNPNFIREFQNRGILRVRLSNLQGLREASDELVSAIRTYETQGGKSSHLDLDVKTGVLKSRLIAYQEDREDHDSPFVHSQFPNQLHIDSVNPELIVLSALVIASKFTQDHQDSSHHYCNIWGRGMWSAEQLNVTERCIMERLEYRIMPLCEESCITDAMVDMQLAGRHHDWHSRQPTPPESLTPHSVEGDFVPSHSRSKTMATTVGLGMLSMGLKGSSVAATGSSAS